MTPKHVPSDEKADKVEVIKPKTSDSKRDSQVEILQPTTTAENSEDNSYDIQLIKEMNMTPRYPTINDAVARKTIVVKNSGQKSWPSNSILEAIDGLTGKTTKLPSLEPGKEFTTVIPIDLPKKTGKFTTTWRFGYPISGKAEMKYCSKKFEFEVEIK